jgi:hypothetical protein
MTKKDKELKHALDILLDIVEDTYPKYYSSDTIAEILDIYKKYFN